MNTLNRIYVVTPDRQLVEDIRAQTYINIDFDLIGSSALMSTALEHLMTMTPDVLIVSENVEMSLDNVVAEMRRIPAKYKLLCLEQKREGENFPFEVMYRPYSAERIIETLISMIAQDNQITEQLEPDVDLEDDESNPFTKAQSKAVIKDDPSYYAPVKKEEGLRGKMAQKEAKEVERTAHAVAQNTPRPQRQKKKQLLLTVFSPKGGVGKTTIAKELAACYALSKVGSRNLRVCLVDFNLDFSDIATMLDISPGMHTSAAWAKDIKQRIERGESIKDIVYDPEVIEKRFLVKKPKDSAGGRYLDNLWVLAGPTNHLDSALIEEKEIEIMVENLRACNFDIIIFDTGNNTRDSSFVALERADFVLMIATQEVSTANDVASFLNVINRIDFDVSKVRLIINQVRPSKLMKVSVDDVKENFAMPCIAEIKDFPAMGGYNNVGMPAVLDGDLEFSKAIQQLAGKIIQVRTPAAQQPEKKKRGLFANLFAKGK